MGLDITGLLTTGIRRMIARNGLMFIAILLPLAPLTVVVSNATLAAAGIMSTNPAVSHPVIQQVANMFPTAALGLFWFVLYIAGVVLNIAMLRTFVTDEETTIPTDNFTRNIGSATVHFILAGLVVLVSVLTGLLLLIIPGIFFLVSFWFFDVFIAAEDRNAIDALKGSWQLTKGRRLPLFALGVGVALIYLAIDLLFLPLYVVTGAGFLGEGLYYELINSASTAVGTVFMLATTAETYNVLQDSIDSDEETSGDSDA